MTPGTQCGDFVACGPLGPFGDEFADGGVIEVVGCAAQPEACAAILIGAYIAIRYGPQIIRALESIAQSSYSFMECVQQYIKDLQACKDAYPPGPDRQNCFEAAAQKFKACKAGGTIQ